ncbi:hypothetical protein AB0M80_36915 [Amycolatopsis sp. NPDC051045]|uniref:hypothetical protein n=1 Tax=Amycolatopsis sp. NPDC051045 TaxID=3156922 RepID=UPI003446638D
MQDRVEDFDQPLLAAPSQDQGRSEGHYSVLAGNRGLVLVAVLAIGVEAVHEPAREVTRDDRIQSRPLVRLDVRSDLLELVRGGDQPGLDHVELQLHRLGRLDGAHHQATGPIVEVHRCGAGQQVPFDPIPVDGLPAEAAGSGDQLDLLGAFRGGDVDRVEPRVQVSRRTIDSFLFSPFEPTRQPRVVLPLNGGEAIQGEHTGVRSVAGFVSTSTSTSGSASVICCRRAGVCSGSSIGSVSHRPSSASASGGATTGTRAIDNSGASPAGTSLCSRAIAGWAGRSASQITSPSRW